MPSSDAAIAVRDDQAAQALLRSRGRHWRLVSRRYRRQAMTRIRFLRYAIEPLVADRFRMAEDASGTYVLGQFKCELRGDVLWVVPTVEYTDEDAVVSDLDPLLKAWEAAIELQHGTALQFRFMGSNGSVVVPVTVTVLPEEQVLETLPKPLELDPDVELLRERVRLIRDNSPWTADHAYYVLTWAEKRYASGGRKRAAVAGALNVEQALLDQLGRLTSSLEGRKHVPNQRRLTTGERQWVAAAIDSLASRIAAKEADRLPLASLRMENLPPLDEPDA